VEGRKECHTCKRKKGYRSFSWVPSTQMYRSSCRVCLNAYMQKRRHGQQTKSKDKPKCRYERRRRRERQIWIYNYLLKHPCKCGETDPVVLDFDHVRGKKRFHITRALGLGYSYETISAEIAKCEVRCSNCHRRATARRQNWSRHRLNLNVRRKVAGGIRKFAVSLESFDTDRNRSPKP